jgi:hypothetical protein
MDGGEGREDLDAALLDAALSRSRVEFDDGAHRRHESEDPLTQTILPAPAGMVTSDHDVDPIAQATGTQIRFCAQTRPDLDAFFVLEGREPGIVAAVDALEERIARHKAATRDPNTGEELRLLTEDLGFGEQASHSALETTRTERGYDLRAAAAVLADEAESYEVAIYGRWCSCMLSRPRRRK